jgi:hypothetical protein
MEKMLTAQSRRALLSRPRPRILLIIALVTATACFLLFSGPAHEFRVIPYTSVDPTNTGPPAAPVAAEGETSYFDGEGDEREPWEIDIEDLRKWRDPDDKEDPTDVEPGYETDGTERDNGQIGKLQHEKDMRKMWRYAYKTTAK